MKIFSGNSNQPLAENICKYLKLPIGDISLKQFPSGEHWCQYKENIRGEDVFLVQSLSQPVNEHLMQLLIMADAARRASAGRITAAIPYFGYARQDRKDKSRVPISAKLIMNLLASSGFNRIVTMDLHAPQIGGFTDLPFDHLSFAPVLIDTIKDIGIECVVAPDIGSVKRADGYARVLNTDLVIISKNRKSETSVEVQSFIGDVTGKKIMVVDDLTESAGTIIEAAAACKSHGAGEIYCVITHGCFTETGRKNLVKAFDEQLIKKLFVSTSVNSNCIWKQTPEFYDIKLLELLPDHSDCIVKVDVSEVFGEAIDCISKNKSVSELFEL